MKFKQNKHKKYAVLLVSKSVFLILAIAFSLLSCNKDDGRKEQNNAKVLRIGEDCGDTYLIQFNNEAVNVPENYTNNVFYAINLPSQYNIENLEINVVFRNPNEYEILNCGARDIAYPQIYVLGVN